MQHQDLQPITLQERIQTIDIIRGFALFGILIINFTVDYRPLNPWVEKPVLDQFFYWPITFLIDDRFRSIYCFLFGLGFSIQMLRAEARNSPFVFIYMRRLIILYLIGVVNQILTAGDILHDYAMVGVLLLLLYKLPRKFLPMLALLCILISWSNSYFINPRQKPGNFISNRIEIPVDSTVLENYVGVYEYLNQRGRKIIVTREGPKLFAEGTSGINQILPKTEKEFFIRTLDTHFTFIKDSVGKAMGIVVHRGNGDSPTARRINMAITQAQKEMVKQRADLAKKWLPPSYKEFVVKNTNDFWLKLKNWSWKRFLMSSMNETLPLFLIGLYFGRRKIFYNISANRRFLQQVWKWGLIVGMTGVTISVGFSAWEYFNSINFNVHSNLTLALEYGLGWEFGVMITAVAIVAGLALILEKENWKKRLSFFAPVGRMGLTNYLLHLGAVTITLSYGLKLTSLGVFGRFMLSLLVFVLLNFFSLWWFKHFRIGPAEWLWRSLTYWKIQPIRLKQTDTSKGTESGVI